MDVIRDRRKGFEGERLAAGEARDQHPEMPAAGFGRRRAWKWVRATARWARDLRLPITQRAFHPETSVGQPWRSSWDR